MITVSKCTARGAQQRKESRGGHTREDFPKADPEFGKINFAHSMPNSTGWKSEIKTVESPLLTLPEELKALLEEGK